MATVDGAASPTSDSSELEACAGSSELGDEAAAASEPLVAGRQADEGSRVPSLKGTRIIALSLALAFVAALLVAGVLSRPRLPEQAVGAEGVEEGLVREFVPLQTCEAEEAEVDYVGANGKALNFVTSKEACAAKCMAVPSCTLWTWVTSTGLPASPTQCWVKSGALEKQLKRLSYRVLSNYVSGCVPARLLRAREPRVSPYILNYQADHAAGEQPTASCGSPGPEPALWFAAPPAGVPVDISVMTFNLAWWSVFDQGRPGELYYHQLTQGNAALKVIYSSVVEHQLDVMAFQECNNVQWLLRMAGLDSTYTGIQGNEGICLAFRNTAWTRIDQGQDVVAEDNKVEYWGRRMAMWARLEHTASGKTLFFMNHHGPLPVGTGGVCGAPATVRRLLSMITAHARYGEPVVLVGDFNAGRTSQTVRLLQNHLSQIASGSMENGIDNIFSNVVPAAVLGRAMLSSGGSDHNPLLAKLRM